jgi:hypothetical protein
MKPRITRRFGVRSTKSISLCRIITCILFCKVTVKAVCLGSAIATLCRLHSSRLSVGPPCSQSHRHVCLWQSECRPNAASRNECSPTFLIKQVRKVSQGFTLLAYSPCCFPCYSRMLSMRSKCSHHFLLFLFWDGYYTQISAVFPFFLVVPDFVRLSREHWDTLAGVERSVYSLYFCRKYREILRPLLIS